MAKEVLARPASPRPPLVAYRDGEVDELPSTRSADGWACPVREAGQPGLVGRRPKAHDRDELGRALELALGYDEWVVVEEAIVGREIEWPCSATPTCGCRCRARSGPAGEFYDYEDKYLDGGAELVIPRRPARRGGRPGPGPRLAGLPGAAGRGHGPGRLLLRGGRPGRGLL